MRMNENDDIDEHSDLKYIKIRTHTSIETKPHKTWQKRKWNELTKKAVEDDGLKARMFYIKEKVREGRELHDKKLDVYRRLREKKDVGKLRGASGTRPNTPN